MSLITMACFDTKENKRSFYTQRTLRSLLETVDFNKHSIIIIDNGSCDETKFVIQAFFLELNKKVGKLPDDRPALIQLSENIGTAGAINQAWKYRKSGENVIKMDNDVEFNFNYGWTDELDEAIRRDPEIGICGLKRKDCWENPGHESEFYRSSLYMLPHQPGERWMIAEQVNHVMGTCQMYSAALLDKIGFLYQPKLYGFDDVFAALRCRLSGFKNVFLPHIEIEHIDTGDNPYQKWKEDHVSESWAQYAQDKADFESGARSIYFNPFQ